MPVANQVVEAEVLIVSRRKDSYGPWKPMRQIKVFNLEDALDQVSKRSDVIDRGLDLAVQVTTLYTDIERAGS